MAPWAVFTVSAVVVALAGTRLARDGDTIAAGTGLGGMWVGAILVAAATSLPELTTDLNAVWQGNPSLAVGDLFGSSMANLLILAVADLLTRRGRVLVRVSVNQALVGVLGILLTVVAGLGVLLGASAVAGLDPSTWAVGLGYVAGMRTLHRNRPEPPFATPAEVREHRPPRGGLQSAAVGFVVAAVVILVAAPYLASSTAMVADRLGISRGFAGVLLLAFTTSLPELVVSVVSIRHGSYDLAVGNLLGSNCFNMAALVPLDVAWGGRSLLAAVDRSLVVTALFAVLLTGLAVLDVLDKAERRRWFVEVTPVCMVATYLVGVWLTYRAHP